ncbi:MAG: hypothetical protein HY304_08100 [candidate division Zixibacteria bacterium]|nr:hypothetical protein [candidate division Zixibacteria bacterium]
MSSPPFRRARAWVSEVGREIVSFAVALLMLLPAVVIHLADRLTMFWIRRRGGLD